MFITDSSKVNITNGKKLKEKKNKKYYVSGDKKLLSEFDRFNLIQTFYDTKKYCPFCEYVIFIGTHQHNKIKIFQNYILFNLQCLVSWYHWFMQSEYK